MQLAGLPLGVVPIEPEKRTVTVTVKTASKAARTFGIRRQQLPLLSGTVSSVHKAQGEKLANVLLDLRSAAGPAPDKAINYVAVSRATSLEAMKSLFPVTLEQLRIKPDKNKMALMTWIRRQYLRHRSAVLELPIGEGDNGLPARGSSSDAPTALWLPPNSENKCFYNCVLAVMLALSDGIDLPDHSLLTPAGGRFFDCLCDVSSAMNAGALSIRVLVSSL